MYLGDDMVDTMEIDKYPSNQVVNEFIIQGATDMFSIKCH